MALAGTSSPSDPNPFVWSVRIRPSANVIKLFHPFVTDEKVAVFFNLPSFWVMSEIAGKVIALNSFENLTKIQFAKHCTVRCMEQLI
jgi:hypothetical protein